MSLISERGNKKVQPVEQVEAVIHYYEPLMRAKYDDYQKREKDLAMLASIAERYKSLQSFLSDLALEPPTESHIVSRSERQERGTNNDFDCPFRKRAGVEQRVCYLDA